MPVIMRKGPLPPDHPFKDGRIILGMKPPGNLKKNPEELKTENKPDIKPVITKETPLEEIGQMFKKIFPETIMEEELQQLMTKDRKDSSSGKKIKN